MKNDNNIAVWAMVGALVFAGICLVINTTKSCDVNIDYKVAVDSNQTEQLPNIAEVKLACYKMCVEQLRAANAQMSLCLDKCEALE